MKMCEIFFKMLKSVFELTYQTPPKVPRKLFNHSLPLKKNYASREGSVESDSHDKQ